MFLLDNNIKSHTDEAIKHVLFLCTNIIVPLTEISVPSNEKKLGMLSRSWWGIPRLEPPTFFPDVISVVITQHNQLITC
jgi:hypothetical protein